MELIVYSNDCISCKESDRLFVIQQFARRNKIPYKVERIPADMFKTSDGTRMGLPVVHYDDKMVDFYKADLAALENLTGKHD